MAQMTDIATKVAGEFEDRAGELDRTGAFPFANYEQLKALGYLAGPVPEELGGLGASLSETARAQRLLAAGCASTALSVNMHLFQVGAAAAGWRTTGANEPLLRRIADEGIVLGSTGAEAIVAGAWETTTTAEHDGDDLVISGRKFFCSQAPAMNLVRVNARDVDTGEILVVAVPANAPGLSVVETWDTLGMRATASHDVVLDKVRIPTTAIGARLPADGPAWHPAFANAIRWFLAGVSGVYLGIADRAVRAAHESLSSARNGAFRDQALTDELLGRLDSAWFRAEAVFELGLKRVDTAPDPVASMVAAIATKQETTTAAVEVVELAVDLAGGGAYFRRNILERLVRDVRAARHHPPAAPVSFQMLGRAALQAATTGTEQGT